MSLKPEFVQTMIALTQSNSLKIVQKKLLSIQKQSLDVIFVLHRAVLVFELHINIAIIFLEHRK